MPVVRCSFKAQWGKLFHTLQGVHQGCLFSPAIFKIFVERLMPETLDHVGTVGIGGRTNDNLRFTNELMDWPEVKRSSSIWLMSWTQHPPCVAWRSVPRRPSSWPTARQDKNCCLWSGTSQPFQISGHHHQ